MDFRPGIRDGESGRTLRPQRGWYPGNPLYQPSGDHWEINRNRVFQQKGDGMKRMSVVIILICAMALLCGIHEAAAGSRTLILKYGTRNSVNDAGGLTIFDGGKILQGTTEVGYYALIFRTVKGGSEDLNQSLVTLNLMFYRSGGTRPTENITIQGNHWFSSGNIKGAVSAASSKYSFATGAVAEAAVISGTNDYSLTIFWTGSMTLP